MSKGKKQKYIVSGTRDFTFASQAFQLVESAKQRIEKLAANAYRVNLDGESFSGEIVRKKQNRYAVQINGNTYEFQIGREESVKRHKARKGKTGDDKVYGLKAPMPGKICEIFVSKGTEVKQGEPILILEAMKMHNQILASGDARVVAIHVKKNDNVLGDQLLAELERL